MNASLPSGKIISVLFIAGLAACSPQADSGDEGGKFAGPDGDARLVYDVGNIDIAVMESLPLQIRISAAGRTRTGGWTDAALVLDEEQSEGIRLVYNFVATPPEGMATQAITPIEASVTYGPWRDRAAREITIIAENNSATIMFPNSGEE